MGEKLVLPSVESNSHEHKESSNKNGPVITKKISKEQIVSTKKPLGSKMKEIFGSPDAKDVKDYILFDFLIPAVKNGIVNIIYLFLFNEVPDRRYESRSRRDTGSGYFDYRSRYGGRASREREGRTENRRRYQDDDRINYRNIVLRDRDAAEDIVYDMQRIIAEDGQISVAQFFDMLDLSSDYTDNNWGWTRKKDISVRRVSNGYLIDVAEAEHLDA